ncbi:MAG: ABC transporter permease [Candidatus Hodarchaeaceae archaeon]|nr:ABC transporter permease [Candidatus Hodarchaeaceae archaeon]
MKLLTIAGKNIRLFSRDRTALFWVIVFPLLLITFLSLIFRGGEISVLLSVVQQDNGQLADAYVSALDNTKIFVIERIDDVAEAEARVRDGKTVAAAIIPPGFTAGSGNVRLIYDEAQGEVATIAVRTIEGVTRAFFRIQVPITIEGVYGKGEKWDPVSHFVSGMSIMFILFSAGMGISVDILNERKAGTFKQNLLAPIGRSSFLGGYFLSAFLIGCLQVLVFFGAGVGVLGLKIAGSIWLIALISAK